MDEAAGRLAGHPAPPRDGHPAVKRRRHFVGDERPARRSPCPPGLVLLSGFETVIELGLDAGSAQPLEPPCCFRVRIEAARDDPRDTCRDDRIDARRRRAVMGARLHRHVERRAARSVAGSRKCNDLTVAAAVALGHAFSHNLAVRDDDRAHGRVRVGDSRGHCRELERAIEAHAPAAARRP